MSENTAKRAPWAITTAVGVGIAAIGLLVLLFATFVNAPDVATSASGYGWAVIIVGVVIAAIGIVLRLLRRQ